MDNKINDKLSKRFLTGLKKYNLDYEEIKKKWYYMGGENGIHRKYLNKNFADTRLKIIVILLMENLFYLLVRVVLINL